jgi:hypothetical protein
MIANKLLCPQINLDSNKGRAVEYLPPYWKKAVAVEAIEGLLITATTGLALDQDL